MHGEFILIVNLSASLALALVLGLLAHSIRLSPIVGYIVAGILLGPQTPGFVANQEMAAEMAEIGVVLLMFGVGLHFDLHELLSVRRIAVPGAAGQILAATLVGTIIVYLSGLDLTAGVIIGVAISVASTVVLIRMLDERSILQTNKGHISVGWLIVEDIFTVLVLVALPAAAKLRNGNDAGDGVLVAIALAIAKVTALVAVVIGGGKVVIPWLLRHVAKTRSRELFTLAVLSIALAVASSAALIFGVSMALGAFLAGMVVGQTSVSQQAAADALPMRDAFSVLFFVSVGMLFDPKILLQHPYLLLSLIATVVIVKPLIAFAIVWFLRYSLETCLTVGIALAQIGEFSFLLADEAGGLGLLPKEGVSLLVACAIVSITLNPYLFAAIEPLRTFLSKKTKLESRSELEGDRINKASVEKLETAENSADVAVIIGYGPVGKTATRILRSFGFQTVVIDLNLDTVQSLVEQGQLAVYGDATRIDILEAAGVRTAKYLLITVPEILSRTLVIMSAHDLNPDMRVLARSRYIQELAWLTEVGATDVVSEEAETAIALATRLLKEIGADRLRIDEELKLIREEINKLRFGQT